MNTFSFRLQPRLMVDLQAMFCVSGALMNKSVVRKLSLVYSLSFLVAQASFGQAQSSVKLIKSVDLVGYTGDFDHFAVDYERNRLLLAAEDHGTVEVFDLKTSAHLRSVEGFGNPHSILVRKGSSTVLITDSEKQGATLRDAESYNKKKSVALTPGSDTSK